MTVRNDKKEPPLMVPFSELHDFATNVKFLIMQKYENYVVFKNLTRSKIGMVIDRFTLIIPNY